MLKYIRQNIDSAQEQAKERINLTLSYKGYNLVTDNHNFKGVETRIYQWINHNKNHCIQLIWDGKEQWFNLGEFKYIDQLNYLNAEQIILVPVRVGKFFNRKKYIYKKVDELIVTLNNDKSTRQ